jgi:hypothetical protein
MNSGHIADNTVETELMLQKELEDLTTHFLRIVLSMESLSGFSGLGLE